MMKSLQTLPTHRSYSSVYFSCFSKIIYTKRFSFSTKIASLFQLKLESSLILYTYTIYILHTYTSYILHPYTYGLKLSQYLGAFYVVYL